MRLDKYFYATDEIGGLYSTQVLADFEKKSKFWFCIESFMRLVGVRLYGCYVREPGAVRNWIGPFYSLVPATY